MSVQREISDSDLVNIPIQPECCQKQKVPKKLAELNKMFDRNLRRDKYWETLERHKFTVTSALLCIAVCLCFFAVVIYMSTQSGNMKLGRLKRNVGPETASCKLRSDYCKALLASMNAIVDVINNNKAYIGNISKNITNTKNTLLREIIDCIECAKSEDEYDSIVSNPLESNRINSQRSNDPSIKISTEIEPDSVNEILENKTDVGNVKHLDGLPEVRTIETIGDEEPKGSDVSTTDRNYVSFISRKEIRNDKENVRSGNKTAVRSIDAISNISESPGKEETTVKSTSMNAEGQDVTIMINEEKLHPSIHPSHQGRTKETAETPLNESESKPKEMEAVQATAKFAANMKGRVLNKYEQRGNIDQNPSLIPTAETMKSSQQLQVTPTMAWMPYPVCFYAPPPASGAKQSSSGQVIFPPSSSGGQFPVSMPQQRGFLNPANQQGSGQPNYVQVQMQSVQLMPMQQYPGNQGQRLGPVGPTGASMQGLPMYPGNPPTGPSGAARPPYFCTYIPAPTFQFPAIPGVSEYQRAASDGSSGNPVDAYPFNSADGKGLVFPGLARVCPSNSYSCADNSRCIRRHQRCDGFVNCPDASDETTCTCRDRISRERICDGYFDCPHGEDELGCFGCPANTFNCGDWKRQYTTENCVLLSQRCDGIRQCPNGRDEMDCTILTDSYMEGKDMFTVGYTSGYLHKNYKGQWYPACTGTKSWVLDACASEIGKSMNGEPKVEVHGIQENAYTGSYLMEEDDEIRVVPTCMNTSVFVRCPPIPCGTNVLSRFEYYPHQDILEDALIRRNAESITDNPENVFENVYAETTKLLDQSWKNDENDTDHIVGVVGGRASKPKAWPSLVAIYKNGNFHCGGVIVNEYWILTAAHCLDGYSNNYYEVQAGMLRRFSFSPMAQIRKAKYAVVHPDYNNRVLLNDLGMILLDEPLRFNRWIRPACLPEVATAGPTWRQGPLSETTCITIGWGAVQEHGPDPDQLREVEVPIWPYCTHQADQSDAVICAGYRQGGYDACQGDSGGPLMCRNPASPSQWYIAGIVSHGEGCAKPNEPGAYTKVSRFVDWIEEVSRGQLIPPLKEVPLDRCPGFSCDGGLGKCLPIEKRCDRMIDCLDGEDEINCPWQDDIDLFGENDQDTEFVTSARGKDEEGKNVTKFANAKTNEKLVEGSDNYIDAATMSTTLSSSSSTTRIKNDDGVTISTPTTDTVTIAATTVPIPLTFTCEKLMQSIPMKKRCDKVIDCEDGTDENNCTCKDYLLNVQPSSICNGQVDGVDGTDEDNCKICEGDEFHCRQSRTCIPSKKMCDGHFDCPLKEDEMDCMILSNGEYVVLDVDGRPEMNLEGVLTRYTNSEWRPTCHRSIMYQNESTAVLIAENVCQYLGFANLDTVAEISVSDSALWTTSFSDENRGRRRARQIMEAGREDKRCPGLYVRCRPVLSSVANAHLVVDPATGSRAYFWPWAGAIFVEGQYRCSAILLESDWLLSSSKCIEDVSLSEKYTTILFGRSATYQHVEGPFEQVSTVDAIKFVKNSEAALLHLKKPVNITRHVQPMFLQKKIYPTLKQDSCVAFGTDDFYETKSVFVQPLLENCPKCHRCFVNKTLEECTEKETSHWSGTIFCLGSKGWYPSAVFHEKNGSCSFRTPQTLTSIDYINAYLTEAMEEDIEPFDEPDCDGIRCTLGKCIGWNKVCDGVEDCRGGEDENHESCLLQKEFCLNEVDGCKCAKSEMRCGNGQCVPKSAFCNGNVDCADGTDEPAICSCMEYLKLTTPGRVCDGIRHCQDKSDESPEVCLCKDSSFRCKSENSTCIPWDFVCDGERDCPEGEDENDCRRVKGSLKDPSGTGEVIRRSYGVWHSDCLPEPVTSREEAAKLCKSFGFESGDVSTENGNNSVPLVPSLDSFYIFRLNSDTWMSMRNDKQLVTLVPPTDTCYRAFVSCS